MKKHHHKPSNSHASSKGKAFEDELNQVAEELVELAKNRLPDKVLRGSLAGLEADIRQDAVLQSLRWYIRGHEDRDSWIAPRAIAASLRCQKRSYSTLRSRDRERMTSFEIQAKAIMPSVDQHPFLLRPCDWSPSVMSAVVTKAIGIALKEKSISPANASIAMEVYVHQSGVRELADRLSVSRGNIYQHLSKVRRVIPRIIEEMEFTLAEPAESRIESTSSK